MIAVAALPILEAVVDAVAYGGEVVKSGLSLLILKNNQKGQKYKEGQEDDSQGEYKIINGFQQEIFCEEEEE